MFQVEMPIAFDGNEREFMATSIRLVNTSEDPGESAGLAAAGRLCSIARQPILDLRGRIHAYELLLRGATGLGGSGEAVSLTLAETAAFWGLQRPSELKKLTGKMTAFVSCPSEALCDQLAQTLPSNLTVLEITAGVDVSPDLIGACLRLKALGFRFALNDFAGQSQSKQLVELADYIKVDFRRTRPDERRAAPQGQPSQPS